MKFFSLDSSFHKYGTILFDIIALNTLWLLTVFLSFGILTPLANAGIMNSIKHVLIDDDGYMLESYIYPFRKRFKTGIALCLIGSFFYGLAGFNIWTILSGVFDARWLLPLYLMIAIEVTMTTTLACALLPETTMTIKQLLKYGFILANKHMLISLACLVPMLVAVAASVFYNMALAFIAIAPAFWLITWLVHKFIFSKYYLDKLV